jgi:hypothetical protein
MQIGDFEIYHNPRIRILVNKLGKILPHFLLNQSFPHRFEGKVCKEKKKYG